MADCRIFQTNPLIVEVDQTPTSPKGGTGKVKKLYYAKIDECNKANMTVYDTTDPNNIKEVISSNEENNTYKTVILDKNAQVVTQKSLQEKVYPEFQKIRAEHIKTTFNKTEIELNYNNVPGVSIGGKPDASKTALTFAGIEERQNLSVGVKNQNQKLPANLYYPKTLNGNSFQQDYIKFQIIEYKPRIFDQKTFARAERYEKLQNGQTKLSLIQSTIHLPIQGGISDNNSVSWNGDPMNAIEQAAAFASLTSQTTDLLKEPNEFTTMIGTLASILENQPTNAALGSYFHQLFARMAANSQSNFFSRGFGAILNPNLELLFNNPDLRPFSFRFDLTPRDKEEATQVRQIIRVFKQTMSARKGVSDIFLKTPMVYEISYINGRNGENHKSIGRIKTCALRSFVVNYTPTNQYMTYNDEANTMSAYSLDMQFQELEPVFYDDYIQFKNADGSANDEIGY